MDKDIYIIVVTFNGEKWLKKCLSTALASDISVKLVIVDNGSTDKTIEIIRSFPKEKIHFIQTDANLGFGKANNLGIEYAVSQGAEYVYLLNQDAYIESNTISVLKDLLQKNNCYAILSPMQYNGDGSRLDNNFEKYALSPSKEDEFVKDILNTNFVMAAHWLLKSSNIRQYGMFNPIFSHYGEDVDYVNRMIYFGLKIGIAKNVIGYHDREYRKVPIEKAIRMNYMTQLSVLTNPNLKASKAQYKFFRSVLSNIKFCFLHFNFKALNENFTQLKKINRLSKMIRTSRNEYKMLNEQNQSL